MNKKVIALSFIYAVIVIGAVILLSKQLDRIPIHAARTFEELDINIKFAFELEPFLKAGFEPNRFNDNMIIKDNLFFLSELSGIDIINNNRSNLGAHFTKGSPGMCFLIFDNGHMFRWFTDGQIQFVINPDLFIEAGLNIDLLEGWELITITLDHGKGETVQRLLLTYR